MIFVGSYVWYITSVLEALLSAQRIKVNANINEGRGITLTSVISVFSRLIVNLILRRLTIIA